MINSHALSKKSVTNSILHTAPIRPAVPWKRLLHLAAVVIALGPSTAQSALVSLYDGSGLPASQPWLVFGSDGFDATQAITAAGTRLQTSTGVRAGYSNYIPLIGTPKNPAFPVLDRAKGFELSFSAQLISEAHANNDRAGFSVILLGSDQKGIELGFWDNEIWAQSASPLFTHSTGTFVDTTQARNYRLRIVGDDYSLLEGNNSLLNGSVEDYTAFGSAPYTLPNYLFLGDNTTSANADVVIGPVSLQSDLTAVPEPNGAPLLIALFAVLQYQRKRQLIIQRPLAI